MPCIQFRHHHFKPSTHRLIEKCNSILEEYGRQGYTVTIRQLYYQLVARDLVKNTAGSYKRVVETMTNARYAGLVDWDAIEDRVRSPRILADWPSVEACVNDALETFRLPRWGGQEYYVEIWCEKEALSGILSRITNQYHVTLMVNRGYSSASAMYEAAARFYAAEEAGLTPILLYLGDHDPSGLDMDRDIQERLNEFGTPVQVERLGLTKRQVETYRPPPWYAKVTDARSPAYVAAHGHESWEVDALPPDVLASIVERRVKAFINEESMQAVRDREDDERAAMQEHVAGFEEDPVSATARMFREVFGG